MIEKRYDYTLKLFCDVCHVSCAWKNKGEYPHNNMNGNILKAKKDGWLVMRYNCLCPKCFKIKKELTCKNSNTKK